MKENKYRILLCENDEFIANMYAYRLQVEGYVVIRINSGEEVIPKMKAIAPHVVIFDLSMPGVTGVEILNQMKETSNEDIAHIPIIIASSGEQKAVLEEFKNLGAIECINTLETLPKDVVHLLQKHLKKMELYTE